MSSSDEDSPGRRKRRRVQISDSVAVCPHSSPLSEEERTESWWTSTEFAQTKSALKQECQKLRHARRYSDCLTDAYERACSLAQRQEASDEDGAVKTDFSEQEDSSGELTVPHSVDEGLLKLADNGPRGLEGYSSKMHALRRHRHVQEAKHAVFLEQARQNLSNQRDAERLAEHAKMASSRARTFAIMVGYADALAARKTSSAPSAADDVLGALPTSESDGGSEERVQANCKDATGAPDDGTEGTSS